MAVSSYASRDIVEMLQTQQPGALDDEITSRRYAIDRQMERNTDLRVELTRNLTGLRSQQDLLDVALKARSDGSYPQQLLRAWESLSSHPRLADAAVRDSTQEGVNERSLFLTTTPDLRLHR